MIQNHIQFLTGCLVSYILPHLMIGTRADQITPKQTGVEIGQRKQLSKKDVEGLNKYYGCGNYFLWLTNKKNVK